MQFENATTPVNVFQGFQRTTFLRIFHQHALVYRFSRIFHHQNDNTPTGKIILIPRLRNLVVYKITFY